MKIKNYFKKTSCIIVLGLFLIPNIIILKATATDVTVVIAQDCPYNIEFTQIDAGDSLMSAIDRNGDLWAWGEGYIGNGENTTQSVPLNISQTIQGNPKFSKVTAGNYNIAGIDTNGNLWTWGNNNKGQLGNGTTTTSSTPINITDQLENKTKFKEVSIEASHMAAIDLEGNLWGWGSNQYAQLSSQNGSENVTTPINISSQIEGNVKFKKVSASDYITFAIDTNENLWRIGNGTSTPTKILENTKFSKVNNTAGIDKEGNLWDIEHENQLVNDGTKFIDVGDYSHCSVAIDSNGELWGWGALKALSVISNTPQKINTETKFEKVTVGNQFVAAIDETGKLWTCGSREYGQIGDGTVNYEDQSTFLKITNAERIVEEPEPQSYTLSIRPGDEEYTQASGTRRNVLAPAVLVTCDENYSGGNQNTLKTQFNRWTLTGGGSISTLENNFTVYTYGESDGILTASYNEVELPTPTREGYTFEGWYKDSGCTDANKINGTTITPTEDITIYAKWNQVQVPDPEPQNYTLSIRPGNEEYTQASGTRRNVLAPAVLVICNENYNGGTEDILKTQFNSWVLTGGGSLDSLSSNRTIYTYGEENGTITATYNAVNLPTPTREGYTFEGWYKDSGCTDVNKINGTIITPTEDITLYAKWIENVDEPREPEQPIEPEELPYIEPKNNYKIKETSEEELYLYRVDPNINIEALESELDTNGTITVYRKKGDTKEKINDDEIIGTGMIVEVEKNGKTLEYIISVKGDVDGNGIATATDLAAMNQQILKEINLDGEFYMALDINNDQEITATDLAAMIQVTLKELKLSNVK